MRKWNIKYLVFSLTMLFGITLGSDEIYAKNEEQVDSVSTQITCTYKLTANRKITGGETLTIVRKLEATNLEDKLVGDQDSYINYVVNNYFNDKKLSNIKNYGGDDKKYYDKNYECPNSFIFYDDNWDLNGKTKIYFSTVEDGNSKGWESNRETKNYAVYVLDKAVYSSDMLAPITKENSCNYTMQGKSDTSISVYTSLYKEKNKLSYNLYVNYYGYGKGGRDETGNNWKIRNRADYLFESPGVVQKVKAAIVSGDCEADYLKYVYYNSSIGGLAFSSQSDLVSVEGANDFDSADEDYVLFINNLAYKEATVGIDETILEFDAVYEEYKKYCTESSSSYNEEKCKAVREEFNELSSNLQSVCSESNLIIAGEEYRNQCTSRLKVAVGNSSTNFNHENAVDCNTIAGIVDLLQTYFNIIKFLVPVLVIGFGILDFIKATASSEDDAIKKAGNKFVKRLLIGVVIILLPLLINIILQLITKYSLTTCGIK